MSDVRFDPNRRGMLRSMAAGSILLPGILQSLLAGETPAAAAGPLAPKAPHFAPKAKRVIFLFATGGVSHMDTFDFKPELLKADGKLHGVGGGLSNQRRPLVKPQWAFRPGGKCGTPVSDLFPCLRERMDDVCLVKSMKSDDNEHYQATLAMHCGSFFFTRPSLGAYIQTRAELLSRTNEIFGWINAGKLTVRIDQSFALQDAARAHSYIEGRETKGKVLLIP